MGYKKGDILKFDRGGFFQVLSVYKDNWVKKQLRKIGIKLRYNQYKIKAK